MNSEIEAKFVDINIGDIREKLTSIHATLEQPMRDMRRVTIDTPDMRQMNAFLRVRDEGNKTTVTYKQFDKLSVDGAKESEIVTSDFDSTVSLLAAAGLLHGSFQESRRETWQLDKVEIVLDEWPWLNPYMEIEGPSEVTIKRVAEQLGLNWSDAIFGDVMAAYRAQYPHLKLDETRGNLPEVRFNTPLPDLLK